MSEESDEMRSYTTISVRPTQKQRLKDNKKPSETYGEALERRNKRMQELEEENEQLKEKIRKLEQED